MSALMYHSEASSGVRGNASSVHACAKHFLEPITKDAFFQMDFVNLIYFAHLVARNLEGN